MRGDPRRTCLGSATCCYDRNGTARTATNLPDNPGGLVVAGSNPAAPTKSPDQIGPRSVGRRPKRVAPLVPVVHPDTTLVADLEAGVLEGVVLRDRSST